LAFWYLFVWEFSELETLDGLVVAIMEEFCLIINLPVFWFSDSGVLCVLVVGNFGDVTVLLRLLDGSLGPSTGCKIVCTWIFRITEKVEWDSTELERRTTLEEEDSEIVRDVEQLSQVCLSLLCDRNE